MAYINNEYYKHGVKHTPLTVADFTHAILFNSEAFKVKTVRQ